MTPEQQAAYIFSQAVSALIEAIGMHSHNMSVLGKEDRYGHFKPVDFNNLIDKYGISHNAVIGLFRGP